MSLQVDYLPVGIADGANVDSQASFQGSPYQLNGFANGTALPSQANKIWRQCSMVASALANFVSNQLNIAVVDDGNLAGLIANLTAAIISAAQGANRRGVSVPFSATPIFDANHGNTFEMLLTGNVTSSTLINVSPWQKITMILKQDGTGGRTFAAPSNLPLSSINTAASKVNVQTFVADAAGVVYIESALVSQ